MQIPGSSFSVSLRDFDHLARFFVNWNGRFEQLSTGRFEGRLRSVCGTSVRLVAVECNQAILLRGRDAPGLFKTYIVDRSNAGALWQGRRLAPGQIVVHGPEADANHLSARRFRSVGFTAAADVIEQAARRLLGAEQTSLPRSWAALTPAPNHSALLNVQFQRYFELGLADATFLSTSEGAQLEQECIHAVVRVAAPDISTRLCLPLHRRTSIVRRADDLMRAHFQEPIGAIDLCSELGVSDRTLRLAFREHFGLGPMTYYRRVRLNAVRTALRSAAGGPVGVTARQFGFHHLGNFAADYRGLFGERPSET